MFADAECEEFAENAGEVEIEEGEIPTSEGVALAPGTYYWQAMYYGDTLHEPGRCERCGGSGYRGRIGVFEVLPITEEIRKLVTNTTDATSIEAGGAHTCARLAGGGIKCWGWNEFGALGDGTDVDRGTPVHVGGQFP